jgi:phosphinothricin acetyltransferase
MQPVESKIRVATEADAAVCADIYAPAVRDNFISFEFDPPTADEMRRRMASTLERFPWLAFERAGQVLGYAYASEHRSRAAYQWSVDVSVYVDPAAHGQGIGTALYRTLLQLVLLQGYCNAFAGIALPNPASVGLHESVGFKRVGVYHDVGFKLGAWRDVLWLELPLQRPAGPPPSPIPFPAIRDSPQALAALQPS